MTKRQSRQQAWFDEALFSGAIGERTHPLMKSYEVWQVDVDARQSALTPFAARQSPFHSEGFAWMTARG